jgi:hypothetical protein
MRKIDCGAQGDAVARASSERALPTVSIFTGPPAGDPQGLNVKYRRSIFHVAQLCASIDRLRAKDPESRPALCFPEIRLRDLQLHGAAHERMIRT